MDILANLVTAQQLENFAVQAYGTDRMNQDQWCYVVASIVGSPCPAYDVGNPPSVRTSADDFLTGLRNWQLGINATYQGPGGSGGVPAAALPSNPGTPPVNPTGAVSSVPTTLGAGLFGPTNCKTCIWLKQNPWALLVAAVGIYFAFFYKK